MVFFLQRRIQPLQARVSKLWTYSGSTNPSRVSPKDPEKHDLEKRVRSLTTLTAKIAVPACLATAFDSTHPLPQVRDLQPEEMFCSLSFSYYILWMLCNRNFYRITNFWLHALLFPRKGPSMLKSLLLTLKPPRLVKIWTGMEPKVLWRNVTPLCRPPS
jgi:hypothetical protein